MEGSLCDVLWADPKDDYSRVPGPDEPLPARVRRVNREFHFRSEVNNFWSFAGADGWV